MVDVGFNGYQPGQSPTDRRAAFDLRRVLRSLAARITILEPEPEPVAGGWHEVGDVGEPAFSGTWANFDGGYQTLRYRKAGDIVRVEGLVKNGVLGTTVFVLPVGYRPIARHVFPVVISDALGRVDAQADGTVNHVVGGAAATYLGIEMEFSTT